MNDPTTQPIRWGTPVALLALGPLAGVVLGALTNVVNGHVSPDYFANAMWWPTDEVPALAVRQGMLEGGALGVAFGVLMAVAVVGSTRGRCPLGLALGKLLRAIGVALACWAVGGAVGVVLATVAPDLLGSKNYYPPSDGPALRRFAWVGKSIWGGYVGTFVGLLYGAVSLHLTWKRSLRAAATGFAVGPVVPMARVR